jgi:threonine dehydrogenase-like Zn-dependent dehydrogenase
MKAIVVTPQKKKSLRLMDIPEPIPASGERLVKILQVGICRTDLEIIEGLYGEPPCGASDLVLGHEAVGQLPDGELVVPMVRRSCGGCDNCRSGNQDMCSTGNFLERGIKGLNGMLCEFIAESPDYLVPISRHALHYAVLAEPMSVVAKGIRQAEVIQKRLIWVPKRALVLGAGPIGLLAVLALRTLGWEVVVVARRPPGTKKSDIAASCGARYLSTAEVPIPELHNNCGKFDLVFEATGSAEAAFDALDSVAVNGVVCLTSVTGGTITKNLPVDKINREMVLGNRVIFGTVNASRADFEQGLRYMEAIDLRFKGVLQRLLTARVPLDKVLSVVDYQVEEIKTLVEIG